MAPTSSPDTCPFLGGDPDMRRTDVLRDDDLFEDTPLKGGNVYSKPQRNPGLFEKLVQLLMIRVIQCPNGILAKTIGKVMIMIQSVSAAPVLPQKRQKFGQNFCHAGQVVLSEWDEVVDILTEKPQARTFMLGPNPLQPKRFPGMVTGKNNRNLFLLALSSKTGTEDEMHEACYGVFMRYIINGGRARQNDQIAKDLILQLTEDYKNMPHGKGGEFFEDSKRGMHMFLIKYIHYCLWGILPSDKEKIDILYEFYYGNKAKTASAYYFKGLGKLFNILEQFSFQRELPKVVKIYEESPSLATMPDPVTSFKLSRNEVAHMTIPIMAIAATVGVRHMLEFTMGGKMFSKHIPGVNTDKIDVREIWDKLDLDNEAEVERYIYEVCRLQTPVSASHHVATKEFTVKILGKDRTFPKGTMISIPIKLAMLDENIWGINTTHEFDHNRKDLVEKSMVFHSVGDKTNGRICPGKSFSIKVVTDVLVECGKVRRQMTG